jgi:competence protein ComEC
MPKTTSRGKWAAIVAAAVILGSILLLVRERRFAASDRVDLWFFDVGQGDAALIRAKDETVLIDGGPDDAILEGLSRALPWWDRRIDVVVATHLDADHFVGLFAALRKYEVGEIWWTGAAPGTETARRFVAEVAERGIPVRIVRAGERLDFGAGRAFSVIFPDEDLRGRAIPKTTTNAKGGGTNDHGIVGVFDCGRERALYTADVSSHVERRLIAAGADLRAEVLKVPHHGSAYSTSDALLDAVRPREAVISVGAGNRYGHPTPRVLAALLARGIAVHRTDRDGPARFICRDGRIRNALVLPF